MPWQTYKEKIHHFSQRIVDAQKPIRILDSIKWLPDFDEKIAKSGYRDIPKTGPEYYQQIELGFDPDKKLTELKEISTDIARELGESDSIGKLLLTTTDQYSDVVHLLLNRGTKKFGEYSRKLYGSTQDKFFEDDNTIVDLGLVMYEILNLVEDDQLGAQFPEKLEAKDVVEELNVRFKKYFSGGEVEARLSDGIVADASAGSDVVKIREGSKFSKRDIDILEVHEGWVHVGTTQNGARQHVAKWLSKGPPRVASTQEGLAVIMEIFSFRTYPRRARSINERILGIAKAEDGANLLEVIEFYRTEGYTEEEALTSAKRIFRGGLPEGGAPFTKDISYCRGFIENYNFMRSAVRAGKAYLLPFLFVGKVHVDDVPMLYAKHREGIIDAPKYLPRQFKDLNGIVVWMAFSNFFNQVNLKKVQEHYFKLFESHL